MGAICTVLLNEPSERARDSRQNRRSHAMTTATLSFGFTLPQRGVFFGVTTAEQMMTVARDVDANPVFDSLWVGDSLLAKPRPDSIALLGALSAATRRVTLGVGCMASFPVRDRSEEHT